MRIDRHGNAGEFLRHSESWLLESEPENNLILGVARRSREHELAKDSNEYWTTLHEKDRIVGAAFRTPPYPLGVSRMPPRAIPLLLDDVADVFPELPGVSGATAVAESFARQWRDRYGGEYRIRFRTRIHVLRTVEDVVNLPAGALRRMEHSDEELIREWMDAFARDVGITVPLEDFVEALLDERRFYLWEDGEPRGVVSNGRDTPRGACVTAVYTPPRHRRKGYARASVATLSRLLLSSGREFCCLYTDLANPTSNSIYRKIGYRPVRDDIELEFEHP